MSLRFAPIPIDEGPWEFLGIDESSSLSQGLVALVCYDLNNTDLVHPNRTFSVASGVNGSSKGFGAVPVVSSSNIVLSTGISLAASSDYTCVCSVSGIGWNGGNPGVWSAGTSINLFQGTTGRPWIRIGGFDDLKPASGWAETAGSDVTFGFRARSAKDLAYASNGRIRHTATTSRNVGAATISNFCYQNTSAEMVSGVWNLIAFWNRGLTDEELESVTEAPKSILRRLGRMVFFTAAPGGASNAPRYFHRTQMGMS